MAERRLIQIDSGLMTAHLWRAGRLTPELELPAAPDSLAGFTSYLLRHSKSLFYLLADVPEEGFVAESVPYVRGPDRQAMLSRKLGQFFYGTPLATTLALGREKGARRDEHCLFTALTRPQFFEPWLAALRGAEAQLAGIYTVPMLASALLKPLGAQGQQMLLLSVGRGGIRQTFFDGGQLRFSRLTPIGLVEAEAVAQACRAESVKLYQYLLGQRIIARSTRLPVVVLAHPDETQVFVEHCRSSEELLFSVADLEPLGRRLGLHAPRAGLSADALFLHLLAARPPSAQLAPPAERRYYRLWRSRFAITAGGAVVMAACLLMAARQIYLTGELREQSAQVNAQAAADAAAYTAVLRGLPPLPTPLDNLRGVVTRYGELDRRSQPMIVLLRELSRALEEQPQVELERLEWLVTANPSAVSATPSAERIGSASGPLHSVAVLAARLPVAMAADQRAQIGAIEDLAGALRRTPGVEVAVLQQPFAFDPTASIRAGTDTARSAEPPRFTLRVSAPL